MLFLVNDVLLEGSADPQELLETFLRENGLPYPATAGPLGDWIKLRQEVLEKLAPLDGKFINWLIGTYAFKRIEFKEMRIDG
jgi:hypothetical protein